MHPGVMTRHSGSSLHDVARTMTTHGVHSVAIWGDEGEDSIGFLGMISALDLLSAVMRGESLASSALVAARQDVHTVRASAPLSDGARLMVDEKASHVIVLADDRDPDRRRALGARGDARAHAHLIDATPSCVHAGVSSSPGAVSAASPMCPAPWRSTIEAR
jgi:CBS domain-containing protein